MEIRKLLTYSFTPNVSTPDRVFRVFSGAGLAVLPALVSVPLWATVTLAVFGLAWAATGVVSRCGMYYLLGYSTCPVDRGRR